MPRQISSLNQDMNELDEVLEARELMNWAVKVESHPEQFTAQEHKYARAIIHYHDKWRAVVYAVKQLNKLGSE